MKTHLPRLEGDIDLLWICALVKDGECESFVGLVELMSGQNASRLSTASKRIPQIAGHTEGSSCWYMVSNAAGVGVYEQRGLEGVVGKQGQGEGHGL